MVHLLLVAHAPLASSLRDVAMHAFPACASQLQVLDIAPDWDLETCKARLRELLPAQEPVLVLVDVLGATPANAVQALLKDRSDAALVHGVNVPMLWRSLCYGHEGLQELARRATEGGLRGIGSLPA